jgi:hypothetical protein
MADSIGWIPAPRKVLGRLREIRVHFGMFDFALYCAVGPLTDVPGYVAWRNDDPGYPQLAPARGYHFVHGRRAPIIWIPRKPRTPREHGTLAHEVFHAVRQMAEWHGIALSRETDEVYCHALGHVVTAILTELRSDAKGSR